MLTPQRLNDIDPRRFFDRAQSVPAEVTQRAQAIVDDVATGGDAALRRWTQELDGIDVSEPLLAPTTWKELAAACPEAIRAAIDGNMRRIEAFHRMQVTSDGTMEVAPGVRLGRRAVPHQVAACYVPGGRASYPSSVLMTVVPARIAGVERIVVATPPRPNGTIDPAVAYAAQAAGATDILLAGGAQAVAALAHGTEHVPRADVIVGPGNAYVTAAKQLVSHRVAIDSPAGPSELLILADEQANPAFVAADLVAQAEHDPDAQCLLVTDSEALAHAVAAELATQSEAADRADIVRASLKDHGAILLTNSMTEALAFSEEYAPEHLEIQTANAAELASQVRNAGSVFIGSHAPVPLGDYGSGTNHVLPTMGHARIRGGLAVEDFRKWVTWQDVTPEGLRHIAPDIIALAEAEGLHGHADAVRRRMEESA